MTFLIQLTIWAPLHNLYEEDYEGDGLWNGIDGSPLDLCIIHRFDYRIYGKASGYHPHLHRWHLHFGARLYRQFGFLHQWCIQ